MLRKAARRRQRCVPSAHASSSGRPAQRAAANRHAGSARRDTSTPLARALHQQVDRAGLDIEGAKRGVVAIKHGAPEDVGRMIASGAAPTRGMWHERNARLFFRRKRAETGEIERLGILGMERAIDRPFEPRHIGKIDKRRGRREIAQEFGKLGAIFDRARRRAAGAAAMKEPAAPSKKSAPTRRCDGRIGQPQRVCQPGHESVAIDVEPVGADRRSSIAAAAPSSRTTQARAHRLLHFKQRRHAAPPVPTRAISAAA